MNVSLEDFLESTQEVDQSPLLLKKQLLEYKKEGIIFFPSNVSELSLDGQLQLYYCYLPSRETKVDAFPVPTKLLQYYREEAMQYHYLKTFFESYYCNKQFDMETFHTYDFYRPYVGNSYSWYTKKAS